MNEFWDWFLRLFRKDYEVIVLYKGKELLGAHTFSFRSLNRAEQKAREFTIQHRRMFGRGDEVEYVVRKRND